MTHLPEKAKEIQTYCIQIYRGAAFPFREHSMPVYVYAYTRYDGTPMLRCQRYQETDIKTQE